MSGDGNKSASADVTVSPEVLLSPWDIAAALVGTCLRPPLMPWRMGNGLLGITNANIERTAKGRIEKYRKWKKK